MCDYQGYDFGANYIDSCCIDGQLYDLDDCDDEGNLYDPGDYRACPKCNTAEVLADCAERISQGSDWGITNEELWAKCVAYCRRQNPKATDAALQAMGPVRCWSPTTEDDERYVALNT